MLYTTHRCIHTLDNNRNSIYTAREIKYGSAKVFIKSSRQYLTLLQWLHVRLGHASEAQLRWIVKNDVVLGTGVSWKELEKLELGLCDI